MDKITNKLIDELRRFKKENKIERIILFGGMAKNRIGKYSDVDLIIVSARFEKTKSFKRAPKLRQKWSLEYPVDMLCYTPAEFEKRKNEPSIVREAIREGVEV
jgi:predicted nucleotidyltransferase